jgi:hypothetical protein
MSLFFIKRVADCQTNTSHGLLHDKVEITKKLKKPKKSKLGYYMELLCDQLAGSSAIPLNPVATHTCASSLIFGRNQADRKLGLLEA